MNKTQKRDMLLSMGRPTEYREEMIDEARRYIAGHADDFDDPVPTVAGLACILGVTRKTIYEWVKDKEKGDFCYILEELGQRQERILVRGGIQGDFNAPITKMMLTKHGYSDKVEADLTSSDGTMTPKGLPDDLAAALDAISGKLSRGDS